MSKAVLNSFFQSFHSALIQLAQSIHSLRFILIHFTSTPFHSIHSDFPSSTHLFIHSFTHSFHFFHFFLSISFTRSRSFHFTHAITRVPPHAFHVHIFRHCRCLHLNTDSLSFTHAFHSVPFLSFRGTHSTSFTLSFIHSFIHSFIP